MTCTDRTIDIFEKFTPCREVPGILIVGFLVCFKVDAEDFEAAQRMQIEMDELKAERELLRLPPAERGLRKAASRCVFANVLVRLFSFRVRVFHRLCLFCW